MTELDQSQSLDARRKRARRTACWVAAVGFVIYLASIFQGWVYS